jgi:hypothetical protein
VQSGRNLDGQLDNKDMEVAQVEIKTTLKQPRRGHVHSVISPRLDAPWLSELAYHLLFRQTRIGVRRRDRLSAAAGKQKRKDDQAR